MQYQITSDNIEISESMKALAQEKIEKVTVRLTEKERDEALVRIVMNKSSEEDQFLVKVELQYGGKKYFSEESAYTLENALIESIGEMERMRRKDDLSHEGDWLEHREIKRSADVLLEEEISNNDDDLVGDPGLEPGTGRV